MKISILTLFPEMFEGPFAHSIVKIAQEKKLITISLVNIRDFGRGAHRTVDDTPYGGGEGMVLRVDVLEKAISFSRDPRLQSNEEKVILLSAHGETFAQKKALTFAKLSHLILICGHYEGFDERIKEFIDEEVSIGNFITTGGEIPAMLIADAVTRLVKGVLSSEATQNESFSPTLAKDSQKNRDRRRYLEYPQYTRPQEYKNLTVPSILLSGDHQKISEWRKKHIKIVS